MTDFEALDQLTRALPGMAFQLVVEPNGDRHYQYLSPALEPMFGLDRSSVYADMQTLLAGIVAEDQARYRQSVELAIATQQPWQLEFRYRRIDGTIIWLRGQSKPQPLADGRVIWHGSVLDISDYKHTEAELRESRGLYRDLADNGGALIWLAGLDKGCFWFNKVWLDFTGRTLEQEQGNGWAEGVHPDDLAVCLEIYTKAFDRREKFSMPYRLRRHDGVYRWIQDDGTPRYDSQGNFIGYIGHCLDITEMRQINAELAAKNQLLESYRTAAQEETRMAKNIFHHVLASHQEDDPVVSCWAAAADAFSGDVIASARSPRGTRYALLADATGHGLAAAISAIPVVRRFFRLVKRDLPIESIARYLNEELLEILPVDHFLCVCLASIDQDGQRFRVWNAGMPAVLQLDARGQCKVQFHANSFPLGIERWNAMMAATAGQMADPGDKLLLISDGVIEALSATGEPFGIERLLWVLASDGGRDPVAAVRTAVTAHMGDVAQSDDISVVCFSAVAV